MRKLSFACFLAMILLLGCTEKHEELLFEQVSIAEVRAQEGSMSKVYEGYEHGTLAKSFYPGSKILLDQSLVTVRKLKLGLPLKTKYYFDPADSVVKFVLYEWNVVTPEMTREEINKHTMNNLAYHSDYVKKFNLLSTQLSDKYGRPTSGDGVLKKEQFQNLERNYTSYTWDLEDKVVELSISLIPTLSYRVITKVYWK